jgi:hypothetical protein
VAYHTPTRLVVALTNDFSWVQILSSKWKSTDRINCAAEPAVGVRVKWRKGKGVPQLPGGGQLQAIDVISGKRIEIEESDGAFQVRLPSFRFMALLVVTRASRRTVPRDSRR